MARPDETDTATSRVLLELERREILLQAGREFASLANIVAGESIAGSWWAHPKSNLIYWVCQDLEAHPRVAEARLLAGKVTHLWDTLWPHVAAIALARHSWQLDGLSPVSRRLLVKSEEIHTPSGRHAKTLSSWNRWWSQHSTGPLPPVDAARQRIESLVGGDCLSLLPWRARLSERASK